MTIESGRKVWQSTHFILTT